MELALSPPRMGAIASDLTCTHNTSSNLSESAVCFLRVPPQRESVRPGVMVWVLEQGEGVRNWGQQHEVHGTARRTVDWTGPALSLASCLRGTGQSSNRVIRCYMLMKPAPSLAAATQSPPVGPVTDGPQCHKSEQKGARTPSRFTVEVIQCAGIRARDSAAL